MAIQVGQATKSAMSRSFGWQFQVDDLVAYVVIRHRKQVERRYLLKASFDDFPRRAPSYLFVDFQSKQMTDAAWPPNVKHGAEPPGICTPGTREFHEHWHLNDAQWPWDPEKLTFLDTLQRIHQLVERGIGG